VNGPAETILIKRKNTDAVIAFFVVTENDIIV
jgi:hypothetical protein